MSVTRYRSVEEMPRPWRDLNDPATSDSWRRCWPFSEAWWVTRLAEWVFSVSVHWKRPTPAGTIRTDAETRVIETPTPRELLRRLGPSDQAHHNLDIRRPAVVLLASPRRAALSGHLRLVVLGYERSREHRAGDRRFDGEGLLEPVL